MVVNGSFARILVLNVLWCTMATPPPRPEARATRRRQFRNDRFVSGLLGPRPGDGQHIPFVFNDILVYCERLISDRSCIDRCHVGGNKGANRPWFTKGLANACKKNSNLYKNTLNVKQCMPRINLKIS